MAGSGSGCGSSPPPSTWTRSPGSTWTPFLSYEVAGVFSSHLGVPAGSGTPERTGEYVAWLGGFWAVDDPTSATTSPEPA
ncbi:hypothetical protein [Sphaerisporangium sp. TRM90804]|uniref:hypothetical protein n=1 Tax=Sphaerisporangium sp. TRM90804 TaxID=3031113 RepID=UPI0024497E35|nr:hypothetical protein [Sphaerisporangium sp. TRM90804]MDH2427922.1 hypothetical protein [Sphaerisporangium sp. TRM90804]